MKIDAVAIIILAAFIFGSCEPAATFNKPQPANEKSVTSFPCVIKTGAQVNINCF